MDSMHRKARMNAADDRLSLLPDNMIHKILSLISIKQAVQTSVLSSRWRFIWTSMPYLSISTDDFRYDFSESVNRILTRRNDQIEVYSLELTFHQMFDESLLKRILNYAFSHNLQQLTVTCLLHSKIDFPVYLFRSRSLKYLRLTGHHINIFYPHSILLASTWDLPALTTLHLDYVAFHDDTLFSTCANLKNLTLINFGILKPYTFTFFHPQISILTINDENWSMQAVNVVAPQLKNLTIRSRNGTQQITITAPNLASILFDSSRHLQFFTDSCSLEKVDLRIFPKYTWTGCKITALLQQLHNAKSLALNLEFIQPLIAYMEGISLLPSPFSNLRSLKIYPVSVPSDDDAYTRINMSVKVLNFFLDGSPGAIFTLISYEEIKEKQQKARETANAVKAQKLMEDLQVKFEELKAHIETNKTRMTTITRPEENSTNQEENDTNDEGKAPVEKMQLLFKRNMIQIKRCCEDVGVRIDQENGNIQLIISQLRNIEVLLLEGLPASNRDELQARYSSLCAKVDTFVKDKLHHIMIPQIQLSDCFNELAACSLPST